MEKSVKASETGRDLIKLADQIISEWRAVRAQRVGTRRIDRMRATRRANRLYERLWKLSQRHNEVERYVDTIGDGPIYL